jgi:hypothetical protein
MGAACSRVCPAACAPVAAHVCTKHRDEEHEAASGPSAAHGCTKDDYLDPPAAPGPSRTCASMEAMGLGACNLWRREKTAAEDEAERTTCQPQPGRARAAPAAHSCRLAASLPLATTAPPAPAASRSPGGRGRRQPHTRAVWLRRRPLTPLGARTTSTSSSLQGDPCGPGCSRPTWSWAPVTCVDRRQRCAQRGRVCGWRRPRPPGLRLAGGSGGAGIGERKRRGQTARVCGWRRPRPPGLRLALVHPSFGDCFRLLPQVTSAQPSGLPRCTSARGPRRCRTVRMVVICAHLCSAGTRRCLVFLVAVLCANVCSDGRARSWTRT